MLETENQDSIRLLDDVNDSLQNQGGGIEAAEGLIFRGLTEWQTIFMNEIETTRVTYELPLWHGQSKYDLHKWVGKITKMEFSREELNPEMLMPGGTLGENRYIQIFEGTGNSKVDTIQDYDTLEMEVFLRALPEYRITRTRGPIIEDIYYDLLVDGVLSKYKKLNPAFKSAEQVRKEAGNIVNRVLELNSATAHRPRAFVRGW